MTAEHFEVDKIHAAHRQLNVAIRLYFNADDPVAVATLAGAAAMVFSALVEQQCPEKSWDKHAQETMKLTPKEYFEVMRRVPNFLKHADKDPDETLRCSLDDVEALIMSAAMNAGELDGDSPSGLVFKLWYLAKWRGIFDQNHKTASHAEQLFSGLANMSRAEQRAFGAQRLREA